MTTTIEAIKRPWQPVEDEEGNLVIPPADDVEEETPPPSSGSLGDYDAAIKQAVLSADSEGNPAIIITYSWTNNGTESASAMMKMLEKAFQNGVQLTAAVMGEDSGYSLESRTQEVPPGTTVEIPCAFKLNSDSDPVEFELSELFSPSGDILARTYDLSVLAPQS